jgi:hypothetical protein
VQMVVSMARTVMICITIMQCNTTFFDAAAGNPNLGLLSTALTSLAPVSMEAA